MRRRKTTGRRRKSRTPSFKGKTSNIYLRQAASFKILTPRKEIAGLLKKAASYFFFRYGFSITEELGLTSWGGRRADLVGCKISGRIVIVEVKSSVADFRTDNKYQTYLQHTNKLYFAMTPHTYLKVKDEIDPEVGVLCLDLETGYMYTAKSAKEQAITKEATINILARLAWRAGDLSKRTQRARERVFLEVEANKL